MAAKSISRRDLLRSTLGAGVATAVGSAVLHAEHLVALASNLRQKSSAKYALVIDTTKCVGCGACRGACTIRNSLPGEISYIHILSQGEAVNRQFLPVQCQHCVDPPCAHVCPTKATYRREDGVVLIHEKLCVGCKYCEVACPYQARIFDEERGVADKCWLCLDYVQSGKNPACVDACVLGARLFGSQDDPNSEVAQLVASGQAKPLHPEFNTQPGILYYVL